MTPKLKAILVNCLKIAVALGLVFWMVRTGRLDFSQLNLFVERPSLFVESVLMWVIAVVILGSFRWWLLLRGIGLDAPYLRTIQLHLIGLFFNSTMPGAVGGDIIKAVYIMRDHDSERKTPAMLTILLDRVIGLMGLFVLAFVAVTIGFNGLWVNAELRPLILSIYGFVAFTMFFYLIVYIPLPENRDPLYRFLNLKVPGFSLLRKIYKAFRSYKKKPRVLVYALLLSILIQTISMFYFIWVTELLNGTPVNVSQFASVFPIGVVATALPLAPGGLGVGHLAFDKLYTLIHLNNGANVFNIYLLVMITLNLSGIIPYMFLKRKK